MFVVLPEESGSCRVSLTVEAPRQEPTSEERRIACPICGYYLTSTTAPWGRIKAYCRGACRKYVYVYLGKPPADDPERERHAFGER